MVDIVNIQNALNQAGYGNNAELIEGLLPVTYADNSGFMKDFQPVQNYPNYFCSTTRFIAKHTYIRHIVRFRCYATKTTTFVKV